jgi:hypothetical protein
LYPVTPCDGLAVQFNSTEWLEPEATAMLKLADAVVAGEPESVTLTVKLEVPAVVGIPEIVPVDAVRVRPAGNAPEVILQLYGVVPFVAANVVE